MNPILDFIKKKERKGFVTVANIRINYLRSPGKLDYEHPVFFVPISLFFQLRSPAQNGLRTPGHMSESSEYLVRNAFHSVLIKRNRQIIHLLISIMKRMNNYVHF
jgi:hypothetical protein